MRNSSKDIPPGTSPDAHQDLSRLAAEQARAAGILPPLSPVVVCGDLPNPLGRLLTLAHEMGPVIMIMDRLEMTAFGYQLAPVGEIQFYNDGWWDKEHVDRLENARAAIRKEAGDRLAVLPNAVVIYGRLGVTLLGDGEVGEMGAEICLIAASTRLPQS
jgi:hypothetical protein